MPALKEIRLQFQGPELEPALDAFGAWLREHHPNQVNFCDQLKGRLNSVKDPYLQGRITYQEYALHTANIRYAGLEKIAELERLANQVQGQQLVPPINHAFTCDRVRQTDAFERMRPSFMPGRIQFFYIYGEELQSHKSFFTRLALEYEGRFMGVGAEIIQRRAFQVPLSIKGSRDPQIYREKLIRDLFFHFGVDPDQHQPLLTRNLQYLIDKSPKLKELKSADAVFILAHVSHWTWHKDLTPDAARWFILEFCQCNLQPDTPLFLFFFSFDYDEAFNSNVKAEILEVVEQSPYVQALPELDMVQRQDVGAWLAHHPQFVPNVQLRNQIIQQHFNAPEFFMEEVERILTKIIDDSKNHLIQ